MAGKGKKRDSIVTVMQDLDYLRCALDGAPISQQAAAAIIFRIIRRLEKLTGVVHFSEQEDDWNPFSDQVPF